MRKKLIGFLLCMILFAGCGQASNQQEETLDQYLIRRSVPLADLICGYAENEKYRSLYPELGDVWDQTDRMVQSLQRNPHTVVFITLSEEELRSVLQEQTNGIELDVRQETYLTGKITSALPHLLSAQAGTNGMLLGSVLTVSESYQAHPELQPMLVFLLYEYDWSVCLSFVPSMEGTALVSAHPLQLEEGWQEYVKNGSMMEELEGYTFDHITVRTLAGEELPALYSDE